MIYHNLSKLRTENVYATMSLLLPTVVHAPRYVTIKDAVRSRITFVGENHWVQ